LSEHTILVHGHPADRDWIEGNAAALRDRRWHADRWHRPKAIENRHGYRKRYYGQPFDPDQWRVVLLDDTHDHCGICTWTIFETDDPDSGTAYRSDGVWICTECHARFLTP